MERRHVIDPYVYMCICLKTTFPIMHCNENRKKDTMRKYCPKMNHRAMEGYCAVEWAANTAHQPTADGRDRGVGFSERVREREWVSECSMSWILCWSSHMMERAMEHFNVQLNRLTRSLRRARTVELPEGETSHNTIYLQTFLFLKTTEVVKATLDTL